MSLAKYSVLSSSLNVKSRLVCLGSLTVEQLTHNCKSEGSNPDTCTFREKMGAEGGVDFRVDCQLLSQSKTL